MGLFNQFIDVIEWVDTTRDTLVWKFPREENEIKNGAQLTVRESQAAVFLSEGQLGDLFHPGRFELTTKNLPILTTLRSWKYGFNSPFKADVYFVNTRQFTDQKWGTTNPVMLRDAEFGPIRLRAFGSYAFSVRDPGKFILTLAGTNPRLVSEDITGQLRSLLVSRFADALGEAKIPALDLAAHYNEMGDLLRGILQKDFDEYGISVDKLLIENISVPPEVEAALDKRTQLGIFTDLGKYTQLQAANALEHAAQNPGGAGNMFGVLAGVNLGGLMGGNLQAATAGAPASAPPPLPATAWFVGIAGRQEGPFSATQLGEKLAAGAINPDSLVWRQGMAGWQKVATVTELSELFGALPPPLPPA